MKNRNHSIPTGNNSAGQIIHIYEKTEWNVTKKFPKKTNSIGNMRIERRVSGSGR
ncbi:MAG: hypothetical protein IKX40_03280 [Thermoguttaceae bacterium]|nr:hypothetical protein [Thermoguttaceae bacterium]